MKSEKAREVLKNAGLKLTPQRLAVLQAIGKLRTHPPADKLIEYIHKHNPNIAIGTVYKILDMFVEKGIINKVKTSEGVMRYDPMTEKHHHLYCTDNQRIEDYFDDEVTHILHLHFAKHKIPDFSIEDIRLEIIGKFT